MEINGAISRVESSPGGRALAAAKCEESAARTRRVFAAPGVLLFVVVSAFAAPSAALAAAPVFTIAQPAASQTIGGVYTFTISASGLPALASVEFALGSKRVGIASAPPFSVTWNTGYASDGSYALQATGRDAIGNVLATAEQIFTIQNQSDSLTVVSPDLTQPLSGWAMLGLSGSDSQYYPAIWMLNLDGEDAGIAWSDNLGQSSATVTGYLDTTRFTNGKHELYIGMHSDTWPAGQSANKSWYNWRGGFERIVDIENGHTLMDLAANYLHVYMQPGEQLALTCTQLFTDNKSGPCTSPSWSSSDASVAAVASDGTLTAGQNEGFATVTVSDSGKTTDVHVWVRTSPGIPHFAGNGRMLNAYESGASLFVVAPFFLPPPDLAADSNLLADVQQAGINTLSQGFYLNPYDINYDYNTWQWAYDNVIEPSWQFAANNGFHILATGDDIARNIGSEAWSTLNWPSGQQAVQYAMQKLAESGVAVSADIIDEASMLWGSTPTPPGQVGGPNSFSSISCSGSTCTVSWDNNPVNSGRFPSGASFALAGSANQNLNTPLGQMYSAVNITSNSFDFTPAAPLNGVFDSGSDPGLQFLWWAGDIGGCPNQPCDPPVPDDALTTIATWLRTAPSTIPISWPVLGIAPSSIQANWMGPNTVSDYASHYWDSFKQRHTYTWTSGIQEQAQWMAYAFYGRQSAMMIDRPQLLLESITGPAYYKNTPNGTFYTPPADRLDQPGVTAPVITSEIMTAAALGAAGVRLYYFERPVNLWSRTNASVGSYLQTGANPTTSDPVVTSNWDAIGYASNVLTKTLTPYVLGVALNSPAYGRNIMTAARQAAQGRMLMIVNDNDWDRTIKVDFTPYRYRGAITRYLVSSDGIATQLLPDSRGQTIILSAGQTAIYLFQPPRAARPLRRVVIGRPTFWGTPAILHYNYVYPDLTSQPRGINCTWGCALTLDPNLGNVYYQFTYLGWRRRVVRQSAIRTIQFPKH